MESIKEAFLIDGITFSDLRKKQKQILETSSEKLKKWEQVILSPKIGSYINIITSHPSYTFLVKSDYPEDLCNKMLSAFINSFEEYNESQRNK